MRVKLFFNSHGQTTLHRATCIKFGCLTKYLLKIWCVSLILKRVAQRISRQNNFLCTILSCESWNVIDWSLVGGLQEFNGDFVIRVCVAEMIDKIWKFLLVCTTQDYDYTRERINENYWCCHLYRSTKRREQPFHSWNFSADRQNVSPLGFCISGAYYVTCIWPMKLNK